jgi:hypothetical protein
MSPQSKPDADISPESISIGDRRDDQLTQASHHPMSKQSHKDIRFWGIMVALCIATLLGGLETTIVTTSLPTIVHELSIGDDYVWIVNVLFLTR